MNDILSYAAAGIGGALAGAGIAFYYADRVFRKSRGPKPAPPAVWFDVPAVMRKGASDVL